MDSVNVTTLTKTVFDRRTGDKAHGMSKLEHDDFWVVEMEGEAKAIFHSDGERRKNDTKEVAAINNEFGV